MTDQPDQSIEDTSEAPARDDPKFEKLVDAFDAGKLDAEFAAWAVEKELQRTGDAIAETDNDKAARAIYQDFAAHRSPWSFDEWLACSTSLHTAEITWILRNEEANTNLRASLRHRSSPDDYGWRPVKEFLECQWEQGARQ